VSPGCRSTGTLRRLGWPSPATKRYVLSWSAKRCASGSLPKSIADEEARPLARDLRDHAFERGVEPLKTALASAVKALSGEINATFWRTRNTLAGGL
jgi:hypothetical protein